MKKKPLIVQPRHLKVYQFVQTFLSKNGYAPTLREIAQKCGSLTTVHRTIHELKSKGCVTFLKNERRSIQVIISPAIKK